ncbi:hypothetical protein PQO03_14115 [Lentisphaera profundi]|uniref:Leucine Rich repeats (2 copies) n=1 Tax=Lentisphaera profundi TaxID=1658616 RepID=A0ABY7VYJ5_9BACT|nr:hypothetical protein [Lentisphaera profundi]WDE98971.1 hypothetical protein PQO03_14115 [Lentisphaera profundi]
MKKLIFLHLLIFNFALFSAETSHLEKYKNTYASHIEKLNKMLNDVKILNSDLAYKDLKNIELMHQKKGELNELVLLRKFLKGLEASALPKLKSSEIPEVQSTLNKLAKNNNNALKKYNLAKSRLQANYRLALQKKMKLLTQQDNITEAINFQTEIANLPTQTKAINFQTDIANLPGPKKVSHTAEKSFPKKQLVSSPRNIKLTDRKVAEYFFSEKGTPHITIMVSNKEVVISSIAQLPNKPFKILQIHYKTPGSYAFTNDDLKTLTNCSALRSIDLWGCNTERITDLGVQYLTKLNHLVYVYVRGAKLTNLSAKYLGSMKSLRRVNFGGPKITDLGLIYIASNRNFTSICMEATSLTDKGLKVLTKLSKLHDLNLAGDKKITDQGLIHLAQIKNMKILYIGGASITDAGITKFKTTLTKCAIYH